MKHTAIACNSGKEHRSTPRALSQSTCCISFGCSSFHTLLCVMKGFIRSASGSGRTEAKADIFSERRGATEGKSRLGRLARTNWYLHPSSPSTLSLLRENYVGMVLAVITGSELIRMSSLSLLHRLYAVRTLQSRGVSQSYH